MMKQKCIRKNQIVLYVQEVLYTYDVLRQDSEVQWDVYLSESLLVPMQAHLYSTTNSILVVLFLLLVVVSILVWNLKQSLASYNAIAVLAGKEQDDEEVDGTGWKLVHNAVFCPPASADHGLILVVVAPVLDVTIPRNHVVPCLSILLVFLGAYSTWKADLIGWFTMMSTIFCAIPISSTLWSPFTAA